MDAKVTTPDGEVINTTAHRTIGATEERDGKTYHRARTWMDKVPQLRPYESLVRLEEGGFFGIDLRDQNPKEVLNIALPLAVGKKWIRDNGTVVVTFEVLALEDLTINGTVYKNCYRIKAAAKDSSYAEEFWQAPGLGSIKSEVTLSAGAKISLTLRSFNPGK